MDRFSETPALDFPAACPGCDDAFDPRRHTESWCQDCRPADGTLWRPPLGTEDRLATASHVGPGNSDVDPANQRAAGKLWGRG